MTHVVFLNGPPRSGKDTAGNIITNAVHGGRTAKFAHVLKVATHALFASLQGRQVELDKHGYGVGHFEELSNDATYEYCKGDPRPEFFGKTPREAYIAVSELLCKPLFGSDFFGRRLADHIILNPDVPVWAITDSGFVDEALPIINAVGRHNCTLVRMHRTGATFTGDSRGYIDLDVPAKLDLRNDCGLGDLGLLIRRAVLANF